MISNKIKQVCHLPLHFEAAVSPYAAWPSFPIGKRSRLAFELCSGRGPSANFRGFGCASAMGLSVVRPSMGGGNAERLIAVLPRVEAMKHTAKRVALRFVPGWDIFAACAIDLATALALWAGLQAVERHLNQ